MQLQGSRLHRMLLVRLMSLAGLSVWYPHSVEPDWRFPQAGGGVTANRQQTY